MILAREVAWEIDGRYVGDCFEVDPDSLGIVMTALVIMVWDVLTSHVTQFSPSSHPHRSPRQRQAWKSKRNKTKENRNAAT